MLVETDLSRRLGHLLDRRDSLLQGIRCGSFWNARASGKRPGALALRQSLAVELRILRLQIRIGCQGYEERVAAFAGIRITYRDSKHMLVRTEGEAHELLDRMESRWLMELPQAGGVQ